MKYWQIEHETREVLYENDADKWNIPRNALLVKPLPTKAGYAVVALDDMRGTQYAEDHRGCTIYDKSNCAVYKTVTELGLVPDGWTLEKPCTQWDAWIYDHWQTDEQAKFEHDYQSVNERRYQLYTVMVDRLRNEAVSIESVENDPEKAAEYRAQADAAYLKIKADNPFPKPPELTP
ncbi:hypothetical protein [Vibrio proteolyticus]